MTEDEFFLARAKLHDYFEKQSIAAGIPINPVTRDDRTIRLPDTVSIGGYQAKKNLNMTH